MGLRAMPRDGPRQPDRTAKARRSVEAIRALGLSGAKSHNRRKSARTSRNAMNINVPTAAVKNEDAANASFEVERHGAGLGAEIHGLDLKKGLDQETFKAFEAALVEHKV